MDVHGDIGKPFTKFRGESSVVGHGASYLIPLAAALRASPVVILIPLAAALRASQVVISHDRA
jgi:hypothetical protein